MRQNTDHRKDRPLALRPVTEENRAAVLALRVAAGQEGLIETTAECLAEADALSLWRPMGIYAGEELIGFAMFGRWKDPPHRVWMDRLMIDGRHQGRGYGRGALRVILRHMFAEYGCGEIYLSLFAENEQAARLYLSEGFRYNGELDTKGEQIMVLQKENFGA